MKNKFSVYQTSKRNGGILFIKYRDVFRFIILIVVLSNTPTISFTQNKRIYSTSIEDSLFCKDKYPFDFDSNNYIYGYGMPEKQVCVVGKSFDTFLKEIQCDLNVRFPAKISHRTIVVSVVVDSVGVIRGVIYDSELSAEIDVISYIYNLLLNYSFTPAYHRHRPVTSYLTIVLKML